MYKGIIVFTLLTLAGTALGASGDSVKLFAGTFEDAAELREVLQNDELTMTRATRSVVPCNVGTRFGIVYLLKISRGMQREKDTWQFTERWDHPEIWVDDQTYSAREISAQFDKRHSSPQFSGWELTKETKADGDVTLTIMRGDEEYLRHKFMVRGCTAETRDELEDMMQAVSNDNTEVVCTEEVETGSRIPKLICKTKAERELEAHMLREEVRR